jgi:hypothetical protein
VAKVNKVVVFKGGKLIDEKGMFYCVVQNKYQMETCLA